MAVKFETDGIRGEAGVYPIDEAGAYQIGQAVGAHFAAEGGLVAIGSDTRESSPILTEAVAAGVLSSGADALRYGVVPTPGLAYLTGSSSEAVAGVMITASHNPWQDNGIKVFDGQGDKLTDRSQELLEELIGMAAAGKRLGNGAAGRVFDGSGEPKRYEDFLVAAAGDGADLSGMRIGLDTANGATSGYAARIFRRLGADVLPLYDRPDGRNINRACGATAMAALSQAVVEHQLHVGAAFDGDGDRLMMTDGLGRVLDGDRLVYLNAVMGGEQEVVTTIMSNMGLEIALENAGVTLHRAAVGDRYVLEALRERGLNLGGEQSGHMIFYKTLTTGDGMLAAIRSVRAARASGLSLEGWYDQVTMLPQKLINVSVSDKHAVADDPRVAELVRDFNDRHDGQGRVLIRKSGTEQVVRVMVEAESADQLADSLAKRIADIASTIN